MDWESRSLFLKILKSLLDQRGIADDRKEVLRRCLQKIKHAEKDCFERTLKEFLRALAPDTSWILDIPAIFEDITELGIRFAKIQHYYGMTYFNILRQGGFGNTPEQVQYLLNWLKQLLTSNTGAAFSLLRGYHYFVQRLSPGELDRYIQEGLSCYEINEHLARQFLEGTLQDREAIIENLSRECRLVDITTQLENLLVALTGQNIAIDHLGSLDSYILKERHSRMVFMYRWLYLPAKINYFDSKTTNKKWYILQTVVAAGMLTCKSFPCIHGHPDYKTAADLIGDSVLIQNLFQIVEYTRVLKTIQDHWPGSKTLVEFGIQREYERCQPERSGPEQLFFDVLGMGRSVGNYCGNIPQTHPLPLPGGEYSPQLPSKRESVQVIRDLVQHSRQVFDTANIIMQINSDLFLKEYPDAGSTLLRSFAFLPDFFYSGVVKTPPSQEYLDVGSTLWRNFAYLPDFFYPAVVRMSPSEETIFELKHSHKPQKSTPQQPREVHATVYTSQDASIAQRFQGRNDENEAASGCYVYDEWNQEKNAYFRRYCYVYERKAPFTRERAILPDVIAEGSKVRRTFELLKPDDARKEKRLSEGDNINEVLLIDYIIATKQEPCPKIQFFEKPAMKKRNIAVLLLLDISGSTGELVNDKKVIDIEKHAALILGQGLAVLGDRFAISGFSSNGREQCEFIIFKDFDDAWNRKSMSRLLSACPMSTTRMGAALRHAGYRLRQVEARQKLIMLISDGKPLDHQYNPQTRYAQHDVRMACLENKRQGIVTFCISTLENTRSDMELMFSDRRFVILNTIRQLTQILPQYYMKLTL